MLKKGFGFSRTITGEVLKDNMGKVKVQNLCALNVNHINCDELHVLYSDLGSSEHDKMIRIKSKSAKVDDYIGCLSLEEVTLDGLDLSGAEVDELHIRGCTISNGYFDGAKIGRAFLSDSDLINTQWNNCAIGTLSIGNCKCDDGGELVKKSDEQAKREVFF